MSYHVVVTPAIRARIGSLDLPNDVLVDVFTRLAGLANNPAAQLTRPASPFDGMMLVIELIDHSDRMCVHEFAFRVWYSMDETQLLVGMPTYTKQYG